METHRIDKWLWCVRIFKTRNKATAACKKGKIKIKGQEVKPSREVKIGDVIFIDLKKFTKTVKVIALLNNRVSAKLVPDYMIDMTPEKEYNKLKAIKETNYEYRQRGLGRPTKKERRMIEKLKKRYKY